MLDTVVLRFHDILGVHARLAQWLDKPEQKTGKTVYMQPVDNDRPSITAQVAFLKLMQYHDTGNLQRVAHFNHLRSDHYEIAYRIDDKRMFVEINLSIPKYIFGTNILHYNTSPMARDFSTSKHSGLKVNLSESYERLYQFINRFVADQFGSIKIDYKLVEINRVDICYNQMFDSKEDALEYLMQLKKLRKQNAREGTNYSRDWKTSITYKTKRWSFKVYHKGSEFAKNDSKKLRAYNEDRTSKFTFDVPFYQEFADRILRYEMTLRNAQMSYLYMNKLFRADCHIWQHGLALWKQANMKKVDFQAYQEFKAGLEPDELKNINYVNSIISKNKKFYLQGNLDSTKYDDDTSPRWWAKFPAQEQHFNGASLFSRELWRLMTRQFLKVLAEFKLEIHADSNSVLKKAEAYNAKIIDERKKSILLGYDKNTSEYRKIGETILLSRLKMLLELLQTKTFEQIEESQLFSRTTWYRYRTTLKKLGVTQTNQLSVALLTDQNLKSYNSEVLYNYSKFVKQ
jgi:hypothetical protein